MVSDDEYKAFLDALARKYLRVARLRRHHPLEFVDRLQHELDRTSRLRRLVALSEEESDNEKLLSALADALSQPSLGGCINALEESGALHAIEEDPITLFANLRRTAIPDEDVELLRQAGHIDPEAEITLIINWTRTHLGNRNTECDPTESVRKAQELVLEAGKRLRNTIIAGGKGPSSSGSAKKKTRKFFNGVGRVLSGAVIGTGNLLPSKNDLASCLLPL
jgi:hypothetical protein